MIANFISGTPRGVMVNKLVSQNYCYYSFNFSYLLLCAMFTFVLNDGQVVLTTLVPLRSTNLSNDEPLQYLDGWPLRNTWYNKQRLLNSDSCYKVKQRWACTVLNMGNYLGIAGIVCTTLVGWVLWRIDPCSSWHINLCRLFNAKYANNQFYFKQFRLAWVHNCQKHFYFKQFSLFK